MLGRQLLAMYWYNLELLPILEVCFMGYLTKGRTLGPSSKGIATSNCSLGTYNPVNFTILKPSDWEQGLKIGIMIDGKGIDLGTLLHLKLVTITHESSSYHVFHSFYEEMQSEFPISVKTKILFLSLAESITQMLNVALCYVCEERIWETIGHGRQKS
jgi:hypothetical protein